MKVYQLSKVNGRYWWTGTCELDYVPEESMEYKWTTDMNVVNELNGKKIKN